MNSFRFATKRLASVVFLTLCIRQAAQALPGDLDTGFSGDGKVATDFSSAGFSSFIANDLAIQTDRKIVVVGGASGRFALARYHSNGSLDTTFGNGGLVTTDVTSFLDTAEGIALQADGKIVLVGTSIDDNSQSRGRVAVARYNSNGSLDTTFGAGGIVTTNFGDSINDNLPVIAIRADGKIVLAGGADGNFALMRLNANGTVDTGFGTSGKVTTDFSGGNDFIRGIVIQADGKIVAGGTGGDGFALARYDSNGNLDTSFGDGGKVTTDFATVTDRGRAIAIQADGKIVVAGSANNNFAVARYNANGSLDTTFSGDGKLTTNFGTHPFSGNESIESGLERVSKV